MKWMIQSANTTWGQMGSDYENQETVFLCTLEMAYSENSHYMPKMSLALIVVIHLFIQQARSIYPLK